jgi:hypothetical protein
MKERLLLSFLFGLMFTIAISQTLDNRDYIMMHYNGYLSKPYPRICFYPKGSKRYLTDSIATNKIQVSPETFQSIKNVIKFNDGANPDSLLLFDNSYQFSISYNGETQILITQYLSRIRKLFFDISRQLYHTDEEQRAQKILSESINRIMYDNKLK